MTDFALVKHPQNLDRSRLPTCHSYGRACYFLASILVVYTYWKMSRMESGACGLCGDMAEATEALCGGAEEAEGKLDYDL